MSRDGRKPVFGVSDQVQHKPSPDLYLEILLEVNLNFQVRLTIILANGIFSRKNLPGSSLLSFNGNIHSLLQIFAEHDL